jgi:hypothetical protein
MNFKKTIMILTITLLFISLGNTASADIIGNATMTGYSYMSGQGSNSNTPDEIYNDGHKEYFIASALSIDENAAEDMWGYGWVKFEALATETVDSAYLTFDLLGVGSMTFGNPYAATEDVPAILDIYDPGEVDVADLRPNDSHDVAAQLALRNTLLASNPITSLTMIANGTYSLDITDLYNSWILDPESNNGIIFASGYEFEGSMEELAQTDPVAFMQMANDSGSVYAGFGREGANAPYISTSAVPVPGAVWLLGSGLLGLMGIRRRKK